MESNNEHRETENNEGLVEESIVEFEEPTSVSWLKNQYRRFQELTAKDVSDNVWLIALKFAMKGFMILILIILSPFILFFLLLSLLVAG